MTTLLEASGLHTYYGASHVLHGVSFSIAAGEVVTLMGRNGMGKTTTIRSVLGLTPPREGSVRVRGREVAGWPAHRIAREGVALVPEGRGIFPTLSVQENLIVAARPGPWDVARALSLFPRLSERLAHLGSQLSGGEQQMLSIARALLTNPALVILDGATEGLAPLVRQEIWAALRKLGKRAPRR
jgi:branched-chain amino acid transport system ATP-binding protein